MLESLLNTLADTSKTNAFTLAATTASQPLQTTLDKAVAKLKQTCVSAPHVYFYTASILSKLLSSTPAGCVRSRLHQLYSEINLAAMSQPGAADKKRAGDLAVFLGVGSAEKRRRGDEGKVAAVVQVRKRGRRAERRAINTMR